ncbi:Uncharacterised protein [Vibrio cholerae]|uniref:Uncharacterized protein n=1 Tax=Vibrio cholerae TaxID=666 RepID=A0A655QCD1_VIBCL|nr:Uncharacterised protein [Vibrio cholerae]CSC33391.1 Uncharacterised protein [Vibrio cholerae]
MAPPPKPLSNAATVSFKLIPATKPPITALNVKATTTFTRIRASSSMTQTEMTTGFIFFLGMLCIPSPLEEARRVGMGLIG